MKQLFEERTVTYGKYNVCFAQYVFIHGTAGRGNKPFAAEASYGEN